MNDEFLSGLQETPSARFQSDLRRRLDDIEAHEAQRDVMRARRTRLRPALAGVTALAIAASLLSMPSVRASARSFLDIFRVQRVATVPVDVVRLQRLHDRNLDVPGLISDQVDVLEDPGQPEPVADVEAAAEIAGLSVGQPSRLPHGCALAEVRVGAPGLMRATIDIDKIDQIADALQVDDLEIPDDMDGVSVEIRTAPTVVLRYSRGEDCFELFQARSPELTLPDGLDVRRLGALGLQMAGMSAAEARAFASRLDWRTTLLVPVPATGADFRDVEVGDVQGVLVSARTHQGPGAPWRSILLWARGDRVLALMGPGRGLELLDMATSIG